MECPNKNRFCFVCGLLAPQKKSRNLTKYVIEGFEGYFLCNYNPYLWYAPDVICDYCRRALEGWREKKGIDPLHKIK